MFSVQAYYLSVPFPVEKAATQKIPLAGDSMKSGVNVSKLINYPVRGLVFEGGNTLNDLANVVSSACIWLQDNNVPYNVLISDCGKRVFLFPQVKIFAQLQFSQILTDSFMMR
jgi:GDP-L-galactose phosphorylase